MALVDDTKGSHTMGWVWDGVRLTDGRSATAMYTKFKMVIIQPQEIAAIVGRRSKFKGHSARPALAHWEVFL